MTGRSLYRRSLTGVPVTTGAPARNPASEDVEGMARLMLDAYAGTVDYEGETIAQAREAVTEYLSERPLLHCSLLLESGGDLTAAVLASWG